MTGKRRLSMDGSGSERRLSRSNLGEHGLSSRIHLFRSLFGNHILSASILWCIILYSCTSIQKLEQAGKYQTIIDRFAPTIDKNSDEENLAVAEAFRRSNRLQESTGFYKASADLATAEPTWYLHYATALKSGGKYDDAVEVLKLGAKMATTESIRRSYEEALSTFDSLPALTGRETYFRVRNMEKLNTALAEYSPVVSQGYLYFVSNRGSRKIYAATGTPYSDIYRCLLAGTDIRESSIRKLDSRINFEDVNEGTASQDKSGRTMIFAKANSGNPHGYTEVNLFYTRYRNGAWLTPRPILINDPKAWDSTPFLVSDGRTLYFSSDREGGFGKSDLYVAHLNPRGRWVGVRNLGPEINTEGHEQFPFLSEDGSLYFSSDGHPGLGKLDIFRAYSKGGETVVENLGIPMNSASDDFGYFEYDLTHGYLSSDRKGGMGDDDIYAFVNDDPDLKVVNYFLTGRVFEKLKHTGVRPIPNVHIQLRRKDGTIVEETYSDDNASFRIRVASEERYDLIASKDQYFTTRQAFSTLERSIDPDTLKEFVTTVEFQTTVFLEKIVLDSAIILSDIFYDLDKAEIRPDASGVLDSLVTLMRDNPDIYIELSSHTDERADHDYNLWLSWERAKAVANYLKDRGISSNRVIYAGYGETRLLVEDASTEEEHQANRRTEFKVLKYLPGIDPELAPDEYDRFFKNKERP